MGGRPVVFQGPHQALHQSIHPRVHLHPHLLGVGLAEPQGEAQAHLGQQPLELHLLVAVQVVNGLRSGFWGGGGGDAQERAAAFALLPVGLLLFGARQAPAVAEREGAAVPLVHTVGGIDKSLHGLLMLLPSLFI